MFLDADGPEALLDVIAEHMSKPKLIWLDYDMLDTALDTLRELINSEDGATALLETEGALDRLASLVSVNESRVRSKALQILACMVVFTDKPLVESALRRAVTAARALELSWSSYSRVTNLKRRRVRTR